MCVCVYEPEGLYFKGHISIPSEPQKKDFILRQNNGWMFATATFPSSLRFPRALNCFTCIYCSKYVPVCWQCVLSVYLKITCAISRHGICSLWMVHWNSFADASCDSKPSSSITLTHLIRVKSEGCMDIFLSILSMFTEDLFCLHSCVATKWLNFVFLSVKLNRHRTDAL